MNANINILRTRNEGQMIIPEECLPLLRQHRTDYDQPQEFINDIRRTFDTICPHLPAGGRILDIGCGMAAIDVLLARHYDGKAKITLLDKQGVSPVINCGFHESAATFSHYHDFELAEYLLDANGVKAHRTVDIGRQRFPVGQFDVAISLLSWGFHYPIDTYHPKIAKGGIIVADVRKRTMGIYELEKRGEVIIVATTRKYERVVVKC